jgi:hypothetical protein
MGAIMDFQKLVMEVFQFLQTDFHFSVESNNRQEEVVFNSEKCRVHIFMERGQVFIDIEDPLDGEKYDLGHTLLALEPGSDFGYSIINFQTPLNVELVRLSRYLRKYCSRLLKGDFFIKKLMKEYFERRERSIRKPKGIGKSRFIFPEDIH